MPTFKVSEDDILIEGERILSSLTEGSQKIIATDKRLIRYITTTHGIGILDLSYDTISSINVFFKSFQKRYFWLSAIGLLLIIVSVVMKDVLKILSIEQQMMMFVIGILLLILGIILKSTESYAGLELLGVAIPEREIKINKNTKVVNLWNFRFKNKDIKEILEFMKVVRSMVNHHRSLRRVHIIEGETKNSHSFIK